MKSEVLKSAEKHGIFVDDIIHAYRFPIRVFVLDDLIILIGSDRAGRLLEIGVSSKQGRELIVHAMTARTKFIER